MMPAMNECARDYGLTWTSASGSKSASTRVSRGDRAHMTSDKDDVSPSLAPDWNAAKEEQHRLRRELILKAAAESFNERGYEGTSLSRIAKKLSMTNGALYYYFAGKPELAHGCLMTAQRKIQACLEKAEEQGENGLDMVEHFVVGLIDANAESRGWTLTGAPYFLSPEQAREVHEMGSENVEFLAKLIVLGVKDGSIRPTEPLGTALLILSSLNFQASTTPFAPAISIDEMKTIARNYVSQSLAALS